MNHFALFCRTAKQVQTCVEVNTETCGEQHARQVWDQSIYISHRVDTMCARKALGCFNQFKYAGNLVISCRFVFVK